MRMNAPSVPVSGSGSGQEKRQRRVDVIIAAGEVVAELVAAEDREDRAAVPEAAERAAPARHRRRRRAPKSLTNAGVVARADERRA